MQTNRAEALAELKRLCQSSAAPALTEDEVGAALDSFQVAVLWQPGTVYPPNSVVCPPVPNGRLYITAGLTSGATEPAWPAPEPWPGASGRTASDGDGRWVYHGIAPPSLWDVRGAARECWLIKAGKAAGCVDITAGRVSRKHSQAHAHCLSMAARFASLEVA